MAFHDDILSEWIKFMLHQENTTFFNNVRCQKHFKTTQTKTIILILLTFAQTAYYLNGFSACKKTRI